MPRKHRACGEEVAVGDRSSRAEWAKIFSHGDPGLERGLLAGLALLLIGLSFGMRIFIIWAQHGFENLFELRTGLVALTLAVSGTQVIFAALFLSLLQVQTRND